MSKSVIKTFIKLYNEGLIYRGVRMVNWDLNVNSPFDEEVIYKEQKSDLFYMKYKIKDSKKIVVVATTRPETILGDSAV